MRYVEMVKHCKPPLYTVGILNDADVALLKRDGYKILKGTKQSNKTKSINSNGIRVV